MKVWESKGTHPPEDPLTCHWTRDLIDLGFFSESEDLGVFPKNWGVSPKLDGENNGKPWKNPIKMDDLGVPLILGKPPYLR